MLIVLNHQLSQIGPPLETGGHPGVCVPIPLIPATQSEGFRPAVPIEDGHLFRSIPATLSERSDAGI